MTCQCCHCCFCCCEQNCDINPNDPKKPKIDSQVTPASPPPLTLPPPLLPPPTPPVVTRSTPFEWPDDLVPGPPTVEEWMERPPIDIIRAQNDDAEEEEQFSFPPKTPEEPPPPTVVQYTPNTQGNPGTPITVNRIDEETTVSQGVNPTQGPPLWIPQTDWDTMVWDGIPISDPYGKTPSQLCTWMFKGRAMKGLRQHYENIQPFADPTRPTIAEVDNWHLEVIKHFRALLGLSANPIELDARLFLEVAWAAQRDRETTWDAEYPGVQDSAYGPCRLPTGGFSTNQHCGASFIPSIEDQGPYYTQYPTISPTMMQTSRAEGIAYQNTDLPWMLKLAGALQSWVCSEGLVGHTGPFVTRSKVGISFRRLNSTTSKIRIKWA